MKLNKMSCILLCFIFVNNSASAVVKTVDHKRASTTNTDEQQKGEDGKNGSSFWDCITAYLKGNSNRIRQSASGEDGKNGKSGSNGGNGGFGFNASGGNGGNAD